MYAFPHGKPLRAALRHGGREHAPVWSVPVRVFLRRGCCTVCVEIKWGCAGHVSVYRPGAGKPVMHGRKYVADVSDYYFPQIVTKPAG